METKQITRTAGKWLAGSIGLAVASYAAYAGITWVRYGHPKRASDEDADALMDDFMPRFDVVERHSVRVAAPAEIALAAAVDVDMESSAAIRAILKARELLLRSRPQHVVRPRGLLAQAKSLGWGQLAEQPGREILMGAVTKPWEANPVFVALPSDEFATFQEPGYVKIIWTLRADPAGNEESILRTETRAVATDTSARRKFRRYWSLLSPGIIAIRIAMRSAVKASAERRWREAA